MKHPEQRVLVLFDVQNMYYSAKHFYDTKVNFKEILNSAVAGRNLIRAIAYVIKTEIKDEVNFHDALNKMGIEVKAKDIQIFQGGAKKGDWDIGISMDAVRLSNKVDTVVMVSGDGDFAELLRYLKSHGCRCEVIAFGQTASKHIKEEADDFLDLSKNIKKYLINYRQKRPMPRRQPQNTASTQQRKILAATMQQKPTTSVPPKLNTGSKNVKRPIVKTTKKTVKKTVNKTPVKKKTPLAPKRVPPMRPPKLNQASKTLDPVQEALMAANLKQVDKKKK